MREFEIKKKTRKEFVSILEGMQGGDQSEQVLSDIKNQKKEQTIQEKEDIYKNSRNS